MAARSPSSPAMRSAQTRRIRITARIAALAAASKMKQPTRLSSRPIRTASPVPIVIFNERLSACNVAPATALLYPLQISRSPP